MRDFDVNSISVNDVLHMLRELDRDGKYEGMFDQFLTFASELTGISEDTLAERLYEGRQNDSRMEIDDSYGLNDGGRIFTVKLAEDRFVDVKVCKDGGPVYVMENEDGSTVYTGEWKPNNTCPGYEYDEKAVLDFVKDHIKEQEIQNVEKYLASVNLGDYGLDWCEFTREDYELLCNEMADRNLSVEKVVHEFLLSVRKALSDEPEENLSSVLASSDLDKAGLRSMIPIMQREGVSLTQLSEELDYRERAGVQEGSAGWDDNFYDYSTKELEFIEKIWSEMESGKDVSKIESGVLEDLVKDAEKLKDRQKMDGKGRELEER